MEELLREVREHLIAKHNVQPTATIMNYIRTLVKQV